MIGRDGTEYLSHICKRLNSSAIRNMAFSVEFLIDRTALFEACSALQIACPSLKRLRFVVGADPAWINQEYLYAVRWVPVDSNLEDLVDFSEQRDMNAKNRRIGGSYGLYRSRIALARVIKDFFSSYIEDFAPEWENLGMEVSFVARKGRNSKEFNIRCEPVENPTFAWATYKSFRNAQKWKS